MTKKEIKDLLDQNMSSKVLKDRKEDLITLMSRLRHGIMKIDVVAGDISDELSIKIGELCKKYYDVYTRQKVKKTNIDTGKVVNTELFLIDNDFIDIPVVVWSTTEKKLTYYTFTLDPKDVTEKLVSKNDESLMDPFYPIKMFHKTIITPIIDEYSKESKQYAEIADANFQTEVSFWNWFNVVEDSSIVEPIDNPYLNEKEHLTDINKMDDTVLNAGLIATLDESKIYDKDSGYNELQAVYNFAKNRLIALANSYDLSPKSIVEDYFDDWRKAIATACLDWNIQLSDTIIEYNCANVPLRGFMSRYIGYLNRVCNTIMREMDIRPSFNELNSNSEIRFNTRYKESVDTCTYYTLGKYPDSAYGRLLEYEIRTVKMVLNGLDEKMELKNKLHDLLHDSKLSNLLDELKDSIEKDENDEDVNSDNIKWN